MGSGECAVLSPSLVSSNGGVADIRLRWGRDFSSYVSCQTLPQM